MADKREQFIKKRKIEESEYNKLKHEDSVAKRIEFNGADDEKGERSEEKGRNQLSKPAPKESSDKMFAIGNSRFVTVSWFRGRMYVSIREYTSGPGNVYPTKRGISLKPYEWENMMKKLSKINMCIKEEIDSHDAGNDEKDY